MTSFPLTPETIQAIQQDRARGHSWSQLAAMHGISVRTVREAALGRYVSNWRPQGYVVTDSGCWEWTGATNGKYGVRRDHRYAHRVAWEEANGRPIPEGMFVCHTCDNPPCVNPAHLWIGTNSDNIKDSVHKGRFGTRRGRPIPAGTHCHRGHPRDLYTVVWADGQRRCRRCHADNQLAHKARLRAAA